MDMDQDLTLTTFLEAGNTLQDDSGYNTFGSENCVSNSSNKLDQALGKLNLEEDEVTTKEDDEEFARICNYLISAFSQDSDGDTYLHILPAKGMLTDMQYLIYYCNDSNLLDLQNKSKQAAIHIVTALDLAEELKMLICNDAKIDLVDIEGRNIIHICAEKGHTKSLLAIIDVCKKRNKMDSLTKLLNATNNNGCTPFYHAVIHKKKEICQLLVDSFPELDVNAVDTKNGNSPLCEAVMSQNADLVYFLLKYCKVEVNFQNNQSVTPLHIAACKGDEAVCAILLEFKAQRELKDINGNTPAAYATNNRILQHVKPGGTS